MQLESDRHAVGIQERRKVMMPAVQVLRPCAVHQRPAVGAADLPRRFRRPFHDQQVDVRHGARRRTRHGTRQQRGALEHHHFDSGLPQLGHQPRHESPDVVSPEVVDDRDGLEDLGLAWQVGKCRHDFPEARRRMRLDRQPRQLRPVEATGHEPTNHLARRIAATRCEQERDFGRSERFEFQGCAHASARPPP
jgi:hypothetical protein